METITIWLAKYPWLVSAACDLVTLACGIGIVGLLLSRRTAPASPTPAPNVPAPPLNRVALQLNDSLTSTAPETPRESPRRPAVEQAVAALSRWEATYRPTGRGLGDLSRYVEEERSARTQPLMQEEQ